MDFWNQNIPLRLKIDLKAVWRVWLCLFNFFCSMIYVYMSPGNTHLHDFCAYNPMQGMVHASFPHKMSWSRWRYWAPQDGGLAVNIFLFLIFYCHRVGNHFYGNSVAEAPLFYFIGNFREKDLLYWPFERGRCIAFIYYVQNNAGSLTGVTFYGLMLHLEGWSSRSIEFIGAAQEWY